MEIHERLRLARQRRFESAAEAARYLNMAQATLNAQELGDRGLKPEQIVRYAKAYRVPASWIAFGEGSIDGRRLIPVVGKVAAGTLKFEDAYAQGAGLDEVEPPPGVGEGWIAVVIDGSSMLPAYHSGDLLFYEKRIEGVPPEMIGRELIVGLADGRILLKRVQRGAQPHLFRLESHNQDPIEDAAVEWVAEFVMLRPLPRRLRPGNGK